MSRFPLSSNTRRRQGQALIEFSLVLPLVLLFIVNAFNFGGFMYSWITVANAARAGVQYAVMGVASAGTPTTPSAAQVAGLISSDAASLSNRGSLLVSVCTNNNGAVTCNGPAVSAPPADTESPHYVLTSVDVTYTYQPLIPVWDFKALGIHATLPATTIHRRTVMRTL